MDLALSAYTHLGLLATVMRKLPFNYKQALRLCGVRLAHPMLRG